VPCFQFKFIRFPDKKSRGPWAVEEFRRGPSAVESVRRGEVGFAYDTPYVIKLNLINSISKQRCNSLLS
jgi:hypothetical protein